MRGTNGFRCSCDRGRCVGGGGVSVTHSTTPLFHVVVLLLSVAFDRAVVSAIRWSLATMRRMIVGGLALALAAFFVVFRPVYNGDMGVYRWRLRFASNADQKLKQLSSTGEAADWQTTPNDYPRFLGNGYWAEVKGVELETDWQSHPPQELWRHEIGARLVGVCDCWRLCGNARAARRERTRYLLSRANRRARLDSRGCDSLRSARCHRRPRRRWPSRYSDDSWRQNLHARRHRHRELPRRPHRPRDLVARHAAEFGATVTVWGKSGSPLVVDDMVLDQRRRADRRLGSRRNGWTVRPRRNLTTRHSSPST